MARENFFENLVSQIYKKNKFFPQNPPESSKYWERFIFSFLLHFFLKVVLWTHKQFFHIFKTVFLKNFFCLFPSVNSKMSRNMCKWRHKVPLLSPWKSKFQAFTILVFKLKFWFSFEALKNKWHQSGYKKYTRAIHFCTHFTNLIPIHNYIFFFIIHKQIE